MIKSLQGGRGIAAVMVVLFHLNGSIFGIADYWPAEFWPGFDIGHSGVYFFFVLSGFIIAHAHAQDTGQPRRLAGYAWRRLVRIYPPYWVVLAVIVPAYLLLEGQVDAPTGAGDILAAVTLWPISSPTLLTVAWTLSHELLFYGLFAILILNRRIGAIVLGLWFAGCAIATVIHPPFPLSFVFAPLNLLFLIGIAGAFIIRRRDVHRPAFTLAIGLATFLGAGAYELVSGLTDWVILGYGLGAGLGVVGAVWMERQGRLTCPAWLAKLGDASYSIYLVHLPVLSLLTKIAFALGLASVFPLPAAFGLLFLISISAGLVFHHLIERPLLARLKPPGRGKGFAR